jgi:glycerol kinase
LGIDEGTTAVKAALFDMRLRPLAEARRPVATSHPAPDRVEQDPEAVLAAVEEAVGEVLAAADPRAPVLAGLAHQGESVLAWDAAGGEPLTPIVVWQDKRQLSLLEEVDEAVAERTGLPLDPYFSAGKLAWLAGNEPVVQHAAARGRLRMGTVDAFLGDRLGARFATDLSTASRTQLLALGASTWDPQLLDAFGLQASWLPALGPTYGTLGTLRSASWSRPLTLHAQLVDQQAALAGSGAIAPGQAKATYGTGVFVLARTEGPRRVAGLLPTVAWADSAGDVAYALDGGVFTAGALLEWLAGELGLAADPARLAALAAEVPDSAGVMVLPALAGLGSPWWQPGARGVIAGLHGGVRPAHIARAALEAIAWRVTDVVEAMAAEVSIERLLVDGGLANDDTLLQIQADTLGLELSVGRTDATVQGAALLAGVGAGALASLQEAVKLLPAVRTVRPRSSAADRAVGRRHWREFAAAAASL